MKLKTLLASALLISSFGTQAQLNNFSVGDAAPDFTVTDLHGQTHSLSDYNGKWVLIDFFAYWCGPCAATAPIINEFYVKYGCNNFDVIVLGLEGDGTTAQTQDFEDQNGGDPAHPTPTVSGLDGGADAVHNTYGPAAYPTIILVGSDGLIKNIDIWPVSSVASIETAFNNAGAASALVQNSCALNTEELAFENNSLYPNPSQGMVKFNISSNNETSLELNVYSVLGTKVKSIKHAILGGKNSLELDFSELSNGHYVLEAVNEAGFAVKTALQIQK